MGLTPSPCRRRRCWGAGLAWLTPCCGDPSRRLAALLASAARAVPGDFAAAVELHVAAVEQQHPQLRPCALNARLRARHRDPEPAGGLDLVRPSNSVSTSASRCLAGSW